MALNGKSPSPDKTITMSVKEYLKGQDQLIDALNQQHNVLTSMMVVCSNGISQIQNQKLALQTTTKSTLEKHGLGADKATLKGFPRIAALLATDKDTIINPLLQQESSKPSGFDKDGKKVRAKREPRDPNAPKRPQTAFFLFLSEWREKLSKENPDKKPGDIAKLATIKWNEASEAEQQKYKDEYTANHEEYKKKFEQWKATGVFDGMPSSDLPTPAISGAPTTASKTEDAEESDDDDDDDDEEDSDDDDEDESESEEEEAPPPPPKEPTPPPVKTPKGRKGKKAAAASAKKEAAAAASAEVLAPPKTPAKTPAKGKKNAATAKAQSPVKAAPTPAPASPQKEEVAPAAPATEKKKKRKSMSSAEAEERKKKRRETLGDDY